jgi:hypothetical protein
VGTQDEQRKGQFKPMMGLPGNRAARRNDDPAHGEVPEKDAAPPARPPNGKRSGQFRGLPRLNLRRDRATEDELAAQSGADDAGPADDSWGDRFAARHAPARSYDTPPRHRARDKERDDDDRARGYGVRGRGYDDGPHGSRGYHDDRGRTYGARDDDEWSARGRAARDDDWDDDDRYARTPKRDPWRRDWVQWTSTDLVVDDIMNYGADDYGLRSRDAWGVEPDPYTMASVALEVGLPRPGAAPGKASNGKHHLNAKGKEKAAVTQFIDWAKQRFDKNMQPTRRAMRVLVALCLLSVVLLTSLGTGLAGLVDYLSIKGLATDAVNSLTHLGDDLGLGKNTAKMTDAQRDAAARSDINRALYDMQTLHDRLAHPDFILSLAASVPKIAPKLQSGLALSNIGIDGAQMLLTLVPTLVSVSKVLTASPISTSSTSADNTPLLQADDLASIASDIQQIQPTLADMIHLIKATPPDILVAALSAKQQSEILPLLQGAQYLPNALNIITQFLNLPDSTAATLLGITHGQVGYLLMTLDNAEIRPVGGFQGQFAVIGVNGGRISHIALQDVYNYLEPVTYTSNTGQGYAVYDTYSLAPVEGWFPAEGKYGLGWVMRNSGLSPDFPQSARYALWYLHNENLCVASNSSNQSNGTCAPCALDNAVGNQGSFYCYAGGDRLPIVDSKGEVKGFSQDRIPMAGVIMIQSRIISQLLEITGPIKVGCPYYREVSASNLQYLIHYYQETYQGRQTSLQHCSAQVSDATKRFTGLVTQALQAKIKDLPKTELLKFVGDIVQDLHTKDIQIYFTDPTRNQVGNGPDAFANGYNPATLYPPEADAEKFLQHYQVSSELYQGGVDDELAMNRADVVGWKLEPYVKLKLVDTIQLGSDHSATHTFQAFYTFDIPPISIKNSDGSLMTYTQIQNAVYDVVYDAAFGQKYGEHWRIYMNPNAISNGGGYPVMSDVPNLDEIAGDLTYSFNINYNTDTIDWIADYSMNPQRSWVVPNVVKQNGVYTIHVQPQSGVNTSADISIILPNGKTCQMMNGALLQNAVLTVNAATGTC